MGQFSQSCLCPRPFWCNKLVRGTTFFPALQLLPTSDSALGASGAGRIFGFLLNQKLALYFEFQPSNFGVPNSIHSHGDVNVVWFLWYCDTGSQQVLSAHWPAVQAGEWTWDSSACWTFGWKCQTVSKKSCMKQIANNDDTNSFNFAPVLFLNFRLPGSFQFAGSIGWIDRFTGSLDE